MASSFITTTPPYIPLPCCSSNKYHLPTTAKLQLKSPRVNKPRSLLFAVPSRSTSTVEPLTTSYGGVSNKIQHLVSEFKSLTEPIDRVKRLLHYAAMLAPMDESGRVPENRVKGCTTQVWVEARIDRDGKVRFRADSDSEITKGFCSCLIWMMDGADPEEVAGVTAEDLVELNVVGVHGKAQSRVNTWQNVLISMRDRTVALAVERQRKQPLPPPFTSFLVSSDGNYTRI